MTPSRDSCWRPVSLAGQAERPRPGIPGGLGGL